MARTALVPLIPPQRSGLVRTVRLNSRVVGAIRILVVLWTLTACACSNPTPPEAPVETPMRDGLPTATADQPGIVFLNEMSDSFRLTRALFIIDKVLVFDRYGTEDRPLPSDMPVSGDLPPGEHVLNVLIQFQGHGSGAYSYLRGYKFEIKSSHAFTTRAGKMLHLAVIAWEKGGATFPLEERPAVRYVETVRMQAPAAERRGERLDAGGQ